MLEVIYCTVYVPAVEADKSIAPVDVLILKPAGAELKVPTDEVRTTLKSSIFNPLPNVLNNLKAIPLADDASLASAV